MDDPRDSRPEVPAGQAKVLHFRKASPPNGSPKTSERVVELSSSDLFALLWQALADILPDGRTRTLEGQTHDVDPKVLAQALGDFFLE